MTSSRRIVFSSLLLITFFITVSTQAKVNFSSFDQALAKTQKQQYTEAIQDLEVLSRQLKKRGDISNAYRSKATAEYIRYKKDSLATYKEKGSYSATPDWINFSTCIGSDTKIKEEGCFGATWVIPRTDINNFGGLIVFDNHLEYFKGASVRGILDTVVVPKLRANELVLGFCTTNSGARKTAAFALVTYNAKQDKYTNIRRAWYPDFQAKRLKPIDPKRVSCPDPYNPEE
jgi:hypothetical protein